MAASVFSGHHAHRRIWCGVALFLSFCVGWSDDAHARAKDPTQDRKLELLPLYTPAAFVHGVMHSHMQPLSARLAHSSAELLHGVQAWCQAEKTQQEALRTTAKAKWRQTLTDWAALQAVTIGPLVERRSQRRIDFQPVRSDAIEEAMARQLPSVDALDAVGSPAKGLPALEWLLWTRPAATHAATCAYAVLLARDVNQEAQALLQGFSALAAENWALQDERASGVTSDIVNQWLGAVEFLRWKEMGQPLWRAMQKNQPNPLPTAFSRPYSQLATRAWQAQWQAIRQLTVQGQASVLAPGQGLVSVELYLRGRGLNTLAQALSEQVRRVDQAMARIALTGVKSASLDQAVKQLGHLRALIEAQVAPALQVNIGFSDADGD